MARNARQRKASSEASDEDTIMVKRENGSKPIDEANSDNNDIKDESLSRSATPLSLSARVKTNHSSSSTPLHKLEGEEPSIKVEADLTEPNNSSSNMANPSKKAMRGSKKNPPRVAPLFDDLPDATEEANKTYTVIDSCWYQNKYLGFTEHAMECDCQEEWGTSDVVKHCSTSNC